MSRQTWWTDALPKGELFDSWATRLGALSIIQVASSISGVKNGETDVFRILTVIATLLLCVATLHPLYKHMKYVADIKRSDATYYAGAGISFLFMCVTFGMSFAWARQMVNAIFTPLGGATLTAVAIVVSSGLIVSRKMRKNRKESEAAADLK